MQGSSKGRYSFARTEKGKQKAMNTLSAQVEDYINSILTGMKELRARYDAGTLHPLEDIRQELEDVDRLVWELIPDLPDERD